MSFQKNANIYLPKGVAGQFASSNPFATVVAGPGGLTAGSLGLTVGKFSWVTYAVAGGPGVAKSFSPTAPVAPTGFVGAEMQALITDYLGSASMKIPGGIPVTLFQRGDFWAKCWNEALITDKVFANLFTGDILADATGAFPVDSFGSASVGLATLVKDSYTMTVTTGTSGVLAVGDLVTMVGLPPKTYVESLGSYNGSTGTVYLSQAAQSTQATPVAFAGAVPEAVGGAEATCSCSSADATMTVTTITAGIAVAAGMLVSGTSIPDGTYVASITSGTGTDGTVIELSANATGAISGATIKFSPWIETPFSVLSAGNVGDLIKIGIKN